MNILYIALKHVIWQFWICNYFRKIFKFRDFKKFREICFARIFVKSREKVYINGTSRSHALKWHIICSYFKSLNFFRTPTPEPLGESFRENLLINSRNQNIFEKIKLNRNRQMIPFKMMYNMSMSRHRFSNEWWGGGGGKGQSIENFTSSSPLGCDFVTSLLPNNTETKPISFVSANLWANQKHDCCKISPKAQDIRNCLWVSKLGRPRWMSWLPLARVWWPKRDIEFTSSRVHPFTSSRVNQFISSRVHQFTSSRGLGPNSWTRELMSSSVHEFMSLGPVLCSKNAALTGESILAWFVGNLVSCLVFNSTSMHSALTKLYLKLNITHIIIPTS